MEQNDYTVFIQAWDFRPGSNFVVEMDRATKCADRTMLVLSPAYLESDYAFAEWAAAFRSDPQSETKRLLPVRVQPCQVNGLLGPVVSIDLVSLDEQQATERLLAGVKLGRAKPETVTFPGRQRLSQSHFDVPFPAAAFAFQEFPKFICPPQESKKKPVDDPKEVGECRLENRQFFKEKIIDDYTSVHIYNTSPQNIEAFNDSHHKQQVYQVQERETLSSAAISQPRLLSEGPVPKSVLPYKTIDMHAAIDLFHQIMQPDSPKRILQIAGDSNMGKSHLIAKVFPVLADEKYHACYAPLDLRYRIFGVAEMLSSACERIPECKQYRDAYQKWHVQRSEISSQKLHRLLFGKRQIRRSDLDWTHLFVQDISRLQKRLLILFIDSIDKAEERIRNWLKHVFLVQLAKQPHVRTILAGDSFLEEDESYTSLTARYQLQPVEDIEEYVLYGRKAELRLEPSAIKAFAEYSNFAPGTFIANVTKFQR